MLDHLQPADEQVAEAVGGGRGRQAEALLELLEDGARLRSDVEVAAEDQGSEPANATARPAASSSSRSADEGVVLT